MVSSVIDAGALGASLAEYKIRDSFHGSIQRYIYFGMAPGSFLQAVITNNLRLAINGADDDWTIKDVRNLLLWFYMEAPSQCHGSKKNFDAWCAAKQVERK